MIIMKGVKVAVIERKRCTSEKCPYQCMKVCPVNRAGKDCITIEKETKFPVISEDLCIACKLCVQRCNRLGRKAISIVNLVQELEKPIHQFGINTFRLYGLPIPSAGKVTGLLGANGTGKTTALRILSGSIQPNLGNYEKQPSWNDIISIFRGTTLQNYLKLLQEKKIKAIYKPQQVDKIPQLAKGTVKDFIKDERDVLDELIEKLELKEILGRQLNELSGGELQRVAIAAAITREGDFYYFDEPSSFLDVRHRLLVSRVIRELAEKKAVMVVEHDLASLDFLADDTHIFYGVPAVYGIVSKPYASKRGVNIYLDGFIKEENIRFRDYEISFKEKGQPFKGKVKAIEWPSLDKRFESFKLNVKEGSACKGEIIGIFGANALGKTTFAKILAGEIKPDNTTLEKKVRITYKPQYLKADSTGTVASLLKSMTTKFNSTEYKAEILKPLELEEILENEVQTLSGGELQRLAIAVCLSQEADIYLLDEPSAYLDVEQRVKFAKLLRRFVQVHEKTALVVDHDLLLLNYISDRAIVFFGVPSKEGSTSQVQLLKDGMNIFLKGLAITYRIDPETGRPRANKIGSVIDREQKAKGEYYAA